MKRDLFDIFCGGIVMALVVVIAIAIVQLIPVKSRTTILNEREYRAISE